MRIDAVKKANEVLVEGGTEAAIQCAVVRFAAARSRMGRAAGDIVLDLFVPMSTPVAAFTKMSALIEDAIKSQRLKVAGQFPTSFVDDPIFETLAPFTTTADPSSMDEDSGSTVSSVVKYGMVIGIVLLTILLLVVIAIMATKYGNSRDTTSFYFRGMNGGSTLKEGPNLLFRPALDLPGYLQIGGGGGRHPLSMHSGHMSTATSPYMDAVPQASPQSNAAIEMLANQVSNWDTAADGAKVGAATLDERSHAPIAGVPLMPGLPPGREGSNAGAAMPLEAPTFHYYPPNSN